MDKKTKFFVTRIGIYFAGLFLLSLGIVMSVRSDLGVSPVSAFPYVLSQFSGYRLGLCTAGVYMIFILSQILMLRRDFKPWMLLQIVGSAVFGTLITGAEWLTGLLPACPNYFVQLLYLAAGILLSGLGILLYMTADILPLPAEGVSAAISFKSGKPLSATKVILDCILVIVAASGSFLLLGRLSGVREGTLLSAIFVGKSIQIFSARWKERLTALMFPAE